MQGFFSKKELQETSSKTKNYSCATCGMYKNIKTPMMVPWGNFKKGIMNIGDFPSHNDDHLSKPFQSQSGRFLQKTYKNLGIDLYEDCINLNAINCSPKKKTINKEITYCRKNVLKAIDKYKPKIIMLFGKEAVMSVIGHRISKNLGGIDKWRGWNIPDQDFKCWINPVFHPKYIYNEDKYIQNIWKRDIEKILKLNSFPTYKEPKINIINDLSILNTIKKGVVAFDIETTGLKPQQRGHRIVSMSIAPDENTAYTFIIPPKPIDRKPIIDLLSSTEIGKVAFNMKFENNWVKTILHTDVVNWEFDPMISTHILDNRKGICNLKFQTYVNFGIIDYDSYISPYLQGEDTKNHNSFNKIMELIPSEENELLTYNGLDSIYTYRLYNKHNELIKFDNLPF